MVSIKRVLEAVMRLVKRIECLGLVSANWTAPPGGGLRSRPSLKQVVSCTERSMSAFQKLLGSVGLLLSRSICPSVRSRFKS